MNGYLDGATIKALREKKSITQKQLANVLSVSDKTVSKWETGRGLPDISIIESLAAALDVSIIELLNNAQVVNSNKHGNILKMNFYACPVCHNVITAIGEATVSCCGVLLPRLEAEVGEDCHKLEVVATDGEFYVTLNHEMSKTHYIAFVAYVTSDCVTITKLYPEQAPEAHFVLRGHGYVYAYCIKDGLFSARV